MSLKFSLNDLFKSKAKVIYLNDFYLAGRIPISNATVNV